MYLLLQSKRVQRWCHSRCYDCVFLGPGEVLRDINFEIKKNELVSVLEVNGAGKTTLLKCINRLGPNLWKSKVAIQRYGELIVDEGRKAHCFVPQNVGTGFPIRCLMWCCWAPPTSSWFVGEGDREKVSEVALRTSVISPSAATTNFRVANANVLFSQRRSLRI